MEHKEEKIGGELIYQGSIIRVEKHTVRMEDGSTALREMVYHPGGVNVVALTPDRQVYMVRQYRYPFGRMLLETPAGKLSPGEVPETCGRRELEEETGMQAKEFRFLGEFYPTVGYDTEVIYLYLATGLTATHQHLDPDEFLDVELFPLSQVVDWVMDGTIQDGKTQAAILKTARAAGHLTTFLSVGISSRSRLIFCPAAGSAAPAG